MSPRAPSADVGDDAPRVVDVGGLVAGDASAIDHVAAEIAAPCADWGVFHIVGHGISKATFADFDRAMRRLFALGEAEKAALRRTRDNAWGYYDTELTKNRRDWKEVFDYGVERPPGAPRPAHSDGVNRWPASHPELRETLLDYYHRCEAVALSLLPALCTALGVAPDALDDAFRNHTSFLRLNRYAPCDDAAPADAPLLPDRGRLGVHHHTDAGAITLLYQDDVPGLQALRGERLVLVEPVPEALTINLGDMLQVWSNDRFRSPVHRVVANRHRERYSAPFFLNPDYDAVCAPLSELVTAETPARFRPVSWGHFRDRRSAGDYDDYGAEIQVDDFRISAGG